MNDQGIFTVCITSETGFLSHARLPTLIFGIILARTKALSSRLKIYSPITKYCKQHILWLPSIQWPCVLVQEREEALLSRRPPDGSAPLDMGSSPVEPLHWQGHCYLSVPGHPLTAWADRHHGGEGLREKGWLSEVKPNVSAIDRDGPMKGYGKIRKKCCWVISSHRSATLLPICCPIFCRWPVKGMI